MANRPANDPKHAQTLIAAERKRVRKGSMRWKTVNGREYLYRKGDDNWKIVGLGSEETERAFHRFREGPCRDQRKNRAA